MEGGVAPDIDLNMPMVSYLVLTWRNIFLLVSMGSQLGGQFWNLMLWGFYREECHGSGGELWRCCG